NAVGLESSIVAWLALWATLGFRSSPGRERRASIGSWNPRAATINWVRLAGKRSEPQAAKPNTPPGLRRGWMQATTSMAPRRGGEEFVSRQFSVRVVKMGASRGLTISSFAIEPLGRQ